MPSVLLYGLLTFYVYNVIHVYTMTYTINTTSNLPGFCFLALPCRLAAVWLTLITWLVVGEFGRCCSGMVVVLVNVLIGVVAFITLPALICVVLIGEPSPASCPLAIPLPCLAACLPYAYAPLPCPWCVVVDWWCCCYYSVGG